MQLLYQIAPHFASIGVGTGALWMRGGGACAVLGPHTMFVWFVTTTVLCKTHVGTGLALSWFFIAVQILF
jgi:hypothetical protein